MSDSDTYEDTSTLVIPLPAVTCINQSTVPEREVEVIDEVRMQFKLHEQKCFSYWYSLHFVGIVDASVARLGGGEMMGGLLILS